MKQEIILVDADGVIFEWEPAFTKWMLNQGYLEIPGTTSEYKIHKRFNVTNSTRTYDLVRQFNESEAISSLEPLRDAVEYIQKLHHTYGFKFHCITSLSIDPAAKKRRQKNLDNVFGKHVFERLICLATGADKDDALLEYKDTGCYWCEDKYQNAAAGLAAGLTPLLMQHEYNQHYYNPDIKIVKTWKEIYNIVIN